MRRKEDLSQRNLLIQLRAVIDLILEDDRPLVVAHAKKRLVALVLANPQGAASHYVQHNLGKGRRAFLADFVRDASASASSLQATLVSSQNFLAEFDELVWNSAESNSN